jgi:hypothetical protein
MTRCVDTINLSFDGAEMEQSDSPNYPNGTGAPSSGGTQRRREMFEFSFPAFRSLLVPVLIPVFATRLSCHPGEE